MNRAIHIAVGLIALHGARLLLTQTTNAIEPQDVSPHREGFVTSKGVRLHYLDWGGEGPNLFFLTGSGNTAHDFDRLAGHFSSRFRIAAMTRRGRSPSDEPRTGYELAQLTEDVRVILDAVGIDRVHFVGHSMAGTEMMQFARLYPRRVLSMVFIDAAVDPAATYLVMKKDPQGPPTSSPGSVDEQIERWWNTHPSDFRSIRVPALAIFALEDRHPYPRPGTSPAMSARLDEYWRTEWTPLVRQTADKFRREVPGGRVVFMNGPHHLYRNNEAQVIHEMDAFYADVLR